MPENVAVLFTDLVGSTELASRLRPAHADALRQRHFSLLRRAIANSDGTEVKNLGDGLMVVFSAASVALSCAVGMQRAIELDNRRSDTPVGLRVGVSAGEATREGDDYFGDPVVEAARLCQIADGGQILASQIVRSLAGRRSAHEFTAVGTLDLKGLPESIETVSVRWEPMAEEGSAAGPLPTRLASAPQVGVVGRDTERAAILHAYKRVAAGDGPEVVLVCGEAGVGKTTLAADAARWAFDGGARVLLGRCDEDVRRPYQPVAEALSHLVAHAPDELLVAHVADHGSELARLVPALARRAPDLPQPKGTDAETDRYLLFSAVAGIISLASDSHPVVLVVDDVMWADQASLQLLRYVATSRPDMRLLVIGTYRDVELSPTHPLHETLGALHRQSRVTRLQLSGLDDAGVLSFMEAAAGHALGGNGEDLAQALYRETDGNPFFVGEVLRHLVENGDLYQDDSGRWTTRADLDQASLPDSVREVIGARVVRLGEVAERTLALAALIGRDFDLDLLARVSERSEDELLDVLDAGAAAALLHEVSDAPGRYSFSHALVGHTISANLGAARRQRLHRRLATALEEEAGNTTAGALAHHWLRAGEPSKALVYAQQAGEAALGQLAPDEAVRWYSQALELAGAQDAGDLAFRCDLLTGLGTAQRQASDAAHRSTLLEAANLARQLRDPDRLVRAALANSRGHASRSGEVDSDRIEVLKAALAVVGTGDSLTRARLEAVLAAELTFAGDRADRIALADEALAIARRVGDPTVLARILNLRFLAIAAPETLDERLANTAEAVALGEELDDPGISFQAAWCRIWACTEAAQIDEVDRQLERMGTLADRLGQRSPRYTSTYFRGWRALLAGRFREAEALYEQAAAIGREMGEFEMVAMTASAQLQLGLQQGKASETVDLTIEAARRNKGVASWRAAVALLCIEGGRESEARDLLAAEASDGFARVGRDQYWLTTMTGWARVCAHLEDAELAGTLYEWLAPWHAQVPFAGGNPQSPVCHALARLATVLADYDAAERHLDELDAMAEWIGAPYWLALSDLERGRVRIARDGGGDRARAALEEARSTAATYGFGGIERQARALFDTAV